MEREVGRRHKKQETSDPKLRMATCRTGAYPNKSMVVSRSLLSWVVRVWMGGRREDGDRQEAEGEKRERGKREGLGKIRVRLVG